MPDSELILRHTDPQDGATLIALARENLRSKWTEPFVQWKYYRNPAGRIIGSCAEMDGQLVGFYGYMPLRIQLGETVVNGAQAVDAMVASALRRLGLFTRLGDKAHAEAAQAGVALSYAIANPISRSGSVKHLAWDDAGQIPRYVRVLDSTALVQASGLQGVKALSYRLAVRLALLINAHRAALADPQVRVREVKNIDLRCDSLWEQNVISFPIAVVRDYAYLTWRYVENPQVRYTILVAERGNGLRGYAVLSHRDLRKGVMALAELLVAPDDELAGLALLSTAAEYARQAGAAQIQCWMLPQHTFYTRLLERSGFLYSSRRFVPGIFGYASSLIVQVVSGVSLDPDPRQLGNWYMTMGDHDYF